MNPAFDLMKLVEKWRDEAENWPGGRHRVIWRMADELAAALSSTDNARVGREVEDEWNQAYAAFKGAFDTPAAWRRQGDEFAQDARKRLRDFNERMTTIATPAQPKASCTCPSGNGSLRWPCPQHPPEPPKASKPLLCGCGRPVAYMTESGALCCNKYGSVCQPKTPESKAGGEDARDAARLDWLYANGHISQQVAPRTVQIACPDGVNGCLVYHTRPLTKDEYRAAIDAAMGAK